MERLVRVISFAHKTFAFQRDEGDVILRYLETLNTVNDFEIIIRNILQ
jgi:hypothetical protein